MALRASSASPITSPPGTVTDKVTRSGRPVSGLIELTGFDGRDVVAPGVDEAGAELQCEMAGRAVELAQHGHGVCRIEDVSHDAVDFGSESITVGQSKGRPHGASPPPDLRDGVGGRDHLRSVRAHAPTLALAGGTGQLTQDQQRQAGSPFV